jgi:VanZ family protein
LQLARVSETILDIPPHIRLLLLVAGVIGIGLVVMESLVGNKSHTIEIDKVIHFTGYALLACAFVLALRPLLMLPVLLLLVAMGMAVEMLQTFNARDFDMSDQYANALGVTVGAALGLLLRTGYAYLRRRAGRGPRRFRPSRTTSSCGTSCQPRRRSGSPRPRPRGGGVRVERPVRSAASLPRTGS